jgi:hypothetical protein
MTTTLNEQETEVHHQRDGRINLSDRNLYMSKGLMLVADDVFSL